MYRSCPLVQNFAKQGLKIRVRKESGPRPKIIQSNKKVIPDNFVSIQPTISNILNENMVKPETLDEKELNDNILKTSSKRLSGHNQGKEKKQKDCALI